MRQKVTHGFIIEFTMGIQQLQSHPQFKYLMFLLNGKLQDVQKNNGLKIEEVHKKHGAILEKYFEMDDGRVKMQPVYKDNSVDGVIDIAAKKEQIGEEPTFLDGKSKEEFNKELMEFLSKETYLDI